MNKNIKVYEIGNLVKNVAVKIKNSVMFKSDKNYGVTFLSLLVKTEQPRLILQK